MIETNLPESLAASIALFRENPQAWWDEWQRVHDFKVRLITENEQLRAEVERLNSSRTPIPPTPAWPLDYDVRPCECGHDWGSHHGHTVSPQCRWCPCMAYAAVRPSSADDKEPT